MGLQALDMAGSFRNNRNMAKRTRERRAKIRQMYADALSYPNAEPYSKEISPEELAAIKANIRAQFTKERKAEIRRSVILYIIIALIAILLVIGMLYILARILQYGYY